MAHKLASRYGVTGPYTSTRIKLIGQIEQRDGYAPDAAEVVELVTCDRCGAVVLSGDSLDTTYTHDQWHNEQERSR